MTFRPTFKVFALLMLWASPCLAGDTDTDQWIYPVLRWVQRERPRAPSRNHDRKQMIVPDVVLRGTTLAEAIAFLRQASIAADVISHAGIQFHLADGLTESRSHVRITLFLHEIPLSAAADYVASSSGCRVIETDGDFVFVAQ